MNDRQAFANDILHTLLRGNQVSLQPPEYRGQKCEFRIPVPASVTDIDFKYTPETKTISNVKTLVLVADYRPNWEHERGYGRLFWFLARVA